MNIDTWQKGYAELSRQFANLKKENLAMKDELIKLRRTYEDQINNLTFDNMPTVKKITLQSEEGVVGLTIKLNETNAQVLTIAEIQTEQGKNIAAADVKADGAKAEANIAAQTATEASNSVALLSVQTDANGARITSLAETQTEQGKSIAKVSQDTAENAASIKSLASVQTEQGKSIAGFEAKATDLEAEIISIAEVQTEQGENIANVSKAANEQGARIDSLAETQTEQGKSIANLTQKTNEQGAEISLAVERASSAEGAASEANGKVSNGAYIIARVNEDGSGVKISADKVAIEGFVTFESLQAPGETTINGANIETGTLAADKIAVGPNGQIDFGRLGSLDFLTESGASGEIRLNENEYGRGEISVRADMYVGISAGSANFILNELPNGDTEARIYAGELVINGNRGLTGTYSLGGGSVTVQNGIVVNVVEGSGGGSGGADSPTTLLKPDVSVNGESAYYTIYNPNGKGKIYYQEAYYDSTGATWSSGVKTSSSMSVSGYFSKVPPYGGELEISAWVEWDGHASPTASASDTMA